MRRVADSSIPEASAGQKRRIGRRIPKGIHLLTKRQIYAPRKGRKSQTLFDGGGLRLIKHSAPSKSVSWAFECQPGHALNGKRTSLIGLGSLHVTNPDKAREHAARFREMEFEGLNPKLEFERQRAANRLPRTATIKIDNGIDLYIKAKAPGWDEKTSRQNEAVLRTYVSPVIGDVDAPDVDRAAVLRVLTHDDLWTKKPPTADRVRRQLRALLDWLTAHGYRPEVKNPAEWKGTLEHALPAIGSVHEVENRPSLPWAQVPAFVKAQVERFDFEVGARALLWLILTGVRSEAVRGASWDEVDVRQARWEIPVERVKGSREPHIVPLPPAAIEVFKRMPRAIGKRASLLMFPSPSGAQPISDMTMLKRCKGWFDPQGRKVVPHGFRASFKSWCADHGYDRDLAEAALSHEIAQNRTEAAYLRTKLIERRIPLMTAWVNHCLGRSPVGNVVNIKKRKARAS